MRRADGPHQELRTVSASLTVRLMVMLAAFFAGGAIARRVGFPAHWGSLAALFSMAFADLVKLSIRELPRQGARFLLRMIMFGAFVVGWLALIWSATQIRYGSWAVFYGSLHVLLTIGLVLVLGWVSDARAMSAVIFGTMPKAVKKPAAGIDDDWHS